MAASTHGATRTEDTDERTVQAMDPACATRDQRSVAKCALRPGDDDACAAGAGISCRRLALSGLGATPDEDSAAARTALESSCAAQDAPSCALLADLLLAGDAAPSCTELGYRLEQRDGYTEEVECLYRQACEGDDASGCNNLASVLLARNQNGAAACLFDQACEDGPNKACVHLGWMIEDGQTGDAEPVEAADYYRRACDAGLPRGCVSLGDLYHEGRGVPQDPVRAAALYRARRLTLCARLQPRSGQRLHPARDLRRERSGRDGGSPARPCADGARL